MSNRFVRPEVVRLELSDGDWIDVKRELTYGERQRLTARSFTGIKTPANAKKTEVETTELTLDMAAYNLARIEAFVINWSFKDERDNQVKVTRAAIDALTEDTATEITEAIDRHVEAWDAEKKATRTSGNGSAPTSPSAGS